jgi:2-dehydro-3-deoxygluconokinase
MRPDVVVIGEPLVELSAPVALTCAETLEIAVSGDAANSAAAAAAAGARTALVGRVSDDDLGRRILRFCAERGIDTAAVLAVDAPSGIYFATADPAGTREFTYVRRGSAGSELARADIDAAPVRHARVVLFSGITHALSATAAVAVEHAARSVAAAGGMVIYDPNFRPRLTTPAAARAALEAIAPHATLVTPSSPGESRALFGTADPEAAAAACLALGAAAVAVTCGPGGVVVDSGAGPVLIPAAPAPEVVDATGAGDVFAGTVAARLALGDALMAAVALGVAASALSVAGRGGTGHLPSLDEIRAHLAAAEAA